MKIKVETEVPLPPARHNWPFGQMEVGHSFLIPSDKVRACRSSSFQYAKVHPGVKFTIRAVGTKHRCWRIA